MTSNCVVEAATEFSFDAAHHFMHFPDGHPNRRLHGHSFRAQITIQGVPDPITGFVCEFSELDRVVAMIRDQLDHQYLNEIETLGPPSLENLAIWIWHRAKMALPETHKVTVFRDSCRQQCSYSGAVTDRLAVSGPVVRSNMVKAGRSDKKMLTSPAE